MKASIYIEGRTVQLVLTPETDFEKLAVKEFTGRPIEATALDGSFQLRPGEPPIETPYTHTELGC